jgi:hypothetical protein
MTDNTTSPAPARDFDGLYKALLEAHLECRAFSGQCF